MLPFARRRAFAAPAKTDARPDLKIEYTGFHSPGVNDRLVEFKVSNVGKAKSTAIKAKVVTLEPEPTPWQRDLDVKSLAPNESVELFYPLGASCNGHRVRATVSDPLDPTSANDRAEAEVCKVKPAPPPSKPTIPADAQSSESAASELGQAALRENNPAAQLTAEDLKPEHLRLGQHTLEFPATVSRYAWVGRVHWHDHDLLCVTSNAPDNSRVDFEFIDDGACETNRVYQYITDVDLDWLRSIEKKLVVRAELLYEERNVLVSKGGADMLAESIAAGRTCIRRAGLAPADFATRIGNRELIPTETSPETASRAAGT